MALAVLGGSFGAAMWIRHKWQRSCEGAGNALKETKLDQVVTEIRKKLGRLLVDLWGVRQFAPSGCGTAASFRKNRGAGPRRNMRCFMA